MKGAEGMLMIDSQFAHMEAPIRKAIATISEGSPSYLVNTHWHGDHVGGNLAFAKGSVVIAQENVRSRMKAGGRGAGPADPAALPDFTYNEGMTVHYNGEAVHLIHFPKSHTDGDTVVFFEGSKVVHMGDLMFNRMFPFIDLGSGGDVEGYLHSQEIVLSMLEEGDKVIPGHGPLASPADLKASVEMLQTSVKLVQARIDEGMDESEAVKAGLPDEYASWSWGFVDTNKWLQTVYRSLTAEREDTKK
jgi:glyoxylase-like metal-dependent hydrolase (beta-lactamase superfamily II)